MNNKPLAEPKKSFVLLILIVNIWPHVYAAEQNFLDMSLQDLMLIEVNTASISPQPISKQPATISVFTEKEIHSLGARNLMEILEHIPGTSFGVDVFGVTSLVFRGHWAHEGKVKLLIDDVPVNDLLYGNLNLANHYPAEQIERVEMVRGAGTARNGGNAGLAMIRVYTKTAKTNGAEAYLSTDQLDGAGGGQQATATGTLVQDDLAVMFSANSTRTPYSGESWISLNNTRYDLSTLDNVDAHNLIGKVDWGNLHYRFFYDYHNNESVQQFGDSGAYGETIEFSSTNWSLEYDWQLSDKITLTPRYEYRKQQDWFIDRTAPLSMGKDFFLPANKKTMNLEMTYWETQWDLLIGTDYWEEQQLCRMPGGGAPCAIRFEGESSVEHHGTAGYIQADWRQGSLNASFGARYSNHSASDDSLVPRLSVAYEINPVWNIKTHLGKASREPNIEVLNAKAPGVETIKPEETTQTEIELRWSPDSQLYGALTLFQMEIAEPIFYSSAISSGAGQYSYQNQDEVQTQGIEMEWHGKFSQKGKFHLSYSFYETFGGDPVEVYNTVHDKNAHLGAPQHKLALSIDQNFGGWSLQPSVVWYSSQYGFTYDPNNIDSVGQNASSKKLEDKTFINIVSRYRLQQWELSLGINDLLDDGREFVQPYHSNSSPYSGPGRKVWLQVSVQF